MMSVVTLLNFYAILGAVGDLLTKAPCVLSFLPFPCESFSGPKVQRAALFVVG
jgi:hypothetical protein